MNESSILTRDEAELRAGQVADVTYDVELDVSGEDPGVFRSTTRMTFATTSADVTTFLDLQAAAVDRVVLNGRTLEDAVSGGRIALSGLAERNEVVIEARCRYSNAGVGLHRFVDPVDDEVFLYTQFEPFEAHRVFACFDQPDLKAPFSLSVIAPADWQVISNGAVTQQPADGAAGRWTFAQTPPIPTYITAVVAGPYHHVHETHGEVEMGLYCRRSLAEHLDPEEIFTLTRQGLDWFEQHFAYPYPFGKYDQLFVPEFNFGAMENPGCVTFSERYVFRSRVTQASRLSRANTILHEMAHMWFGDLVTMKWWDDLWLNESFATFIAHTAVAEATRFGEDSWSDFAHSMKAWAYQQDQLPSTHPIVADMVDTDAVMANFDGITYAKGASVLKQLHAWVGADAFMEGLRDYFPRHEWGNATLADFLAALEGPSGRDLAPWATTWLQTAGVATLSATIESGAEGSMQSVTICQDAPEDHPTVRPHRLRIGLYDTVGGRLVRSDIGEADIDGPSTAVPALAGRPRPDLLLINDDDLAYAKVRLDEVSVQTLEQALGTLEGGVARAVCWGSLWDATRDAELAARRFADLVAQHGPSEPDISVLQTLLRQAFACADRYAAEENRQPIRQRLAGVARDQLQGAEPGSDRQLVWVRSLLSARVDPSFGLGLLDGSTQIESLPLDPDLRWFTVTNLAATGHLGEEVIDEELRRDPTDVGQRGAEAARAAQPVTGAKAAAWQRMLDSNLALHTRRAILSGFWQVDQADLLAQHATAGWVEVLPAIWAGSATEEALAMTGSLYPSAIVSDEVVTAADRALALDLPAVGKRSLSESRDATLRAMRARKADTA
ncbi:aminopeptidase N [soil metagenome]